MSDLQCPATLLVSRHGDSEYAAAGVLSDEGGRLTVKGRAQVDRLVEQVRSRRVAAVYSSRMQRAAESAELAASELGLRPVVVDGLEEFSVGVLAGLNFHDERAQQVFDAWLLGDLDVGCPGAESGHDVVKRFLPNCVPAEVEVDADGWSLVSWPGMAHEVMSSEQA